MRHVTRLEVNGLFGHARHVVHFRENAPTILTAPNGAGKTHVLSLLRAALALDLGLLLATSFSDMRVDLSDGRSLAIRREVDESLDPIVTIAALKGDNVLGSTLRVGSRLFESFNPDLPPYVRPAGNDRWLDVRTGRAYGRQALERRFRVQVGLPTEMLDGCPDVRDICADPLPVFIDTKRLDVAGAEYTPGEFGTGITRETISAASRIHEYTEQLRSEVNEARRNSIQATQSADLSFAARALAAARMTVKEADLHKRYDRTVERYETLARNSLAVGDAPLEFPQKTTPTVRRILSVFLDDWDKRLEPLIPLNEKIQTLREILDSKLAPSGKRTAMSTHGNLEFRTFSGRRIRVAKLSSGEQHLVALFTMLLFSAKPRSLVLIDEPEISLHAAWKHAFLDDIARVAAVGNLQIVMATHSSAIINGRWDLTEELVLTPGPDGVAAVDSGHGDDDTDDLDD
ncbi:AAA family ATPase [Salana multivorans]